MQFELTALKQRRFKKSVTFKVPLEKIDETGETVKGQAHFIAHLVEQPKDAAKESQSKLEVLQSNILRLKEKYQEEQTEENFQAFKTLERESVEVMQQVAKENLIKQWVGFEKHPLHAMPFLVNGQELQSSPEAIAQLLELDVVKEAVTRAYIDELNPGLRKLLEGNSNK